MNQVVDGIEPDRVAGWGDWPAGAVDEACAAESIECCFECFFPISILSISSLFFIFFHPLISRAYGGRVQVLFLIRTSAWASQVILNFYLSAGRLFH